MFEVGKIYSLRIKYDFIHDPSYFLIKILEIKKDNNIRYVCFIINPESREIFLDQNKGHPQETYQEDIIENYIIKQKTKKFWYKIVRQYYESR